VTDSTQDILIAERVRSKFEAQMTNPEELITSRVAKFLVPRHDAIIQRYREEDKKPAEAYAADHCSEIFVNAKDEVIKELAEIYGGESTGGGRSRLNQAVTSNSGKMFERFTAYAASKSLEGTGWAIWKDKKDIEEVIGISKKKFLGLSRNIFESSIPIEIELEADYVAFYASAPLDYPIVLFNCKTSLKERLHQATMWAMLLKIVSDSRLREIFNITTQSSALMKNCKYALVSGDFAEEQPDLKKSVPRNLIRFDFSFFDFVFAAVTSEWNPNIPSKFNPNKNSQQMYRLSVLREVLLSLKSYTDSNETL
jgi:hypothetical protein